MKINYIRIRNFRSILDLELDLSNAQSYIAICGENNVGKTNLLRAIDLFFYPAKYNSELDRPMIKHATGGSRVDPTIEIHFKNEDVIYKFIRDLKYEESVLDATRKFSKNLHGSKVVISVNNVEKELLYEEIQQLIELIEFRFIESINVDIPDLIEKLTDDAIDVEYEKQKISHNKIALKEAYDNYVTGIQEILDVFSQDISSVFHKFRESWDVKFYVPKKSNNFRELISDDVELHLDDKGCKNIIQKGSGLQRLAVILLNFEILKRIKNKKYFIVCIDEPDIYLHEGLQRKLMNFFKDTSSKFQIFYTTHSKIFVDNYNLDSVLLLSAEYTSQFSVRKKRNINVAKTYLINTTTENGYDKICEQLGIEKTYYNLLESCNIIVEGECDKNYLEELRKYFGLPYINIISLEGVNNLFKYLDLYESFYKKLSSVKPKIKILFDNDNAGREVYNKLNVSKYKNIELKTNFIISCISKSEKNANHEIEDFIYPEIMCELVNMLLGKTGYKKISPFKIIKNLSMPSKSQEGILKILEDEKNEKNPQNGHNIPLTSVSIKGSLSKMFKIEGNIKMVSLLKKGEEQYPKLKEFINNLYNF